MDVLGLMQFDGWMGKLDGLINVMMDELYG